jgi:flagellar hook assembly protein FlgD
VEILATDDLDEVEAKLEALSSVGVGNVRVDGAKGDYRISFVGSLAGADHVTLSIYDVAGRRVRTLVDTPHTAGAHTVTWNGTNDRGATVSSGIYFYRLRAGAFAETHKMVLLK